MEEWIGSRPAAWCAFAAAVSVLGPALAASASLGAENLDRGAVALGLPDGAVYIGWRLLPSDPPDRGFEVWRRDAAGRTPWIRLAERPVAGSTNFVDRTARPKVGYRYEIRIPDKGACASVQVPAEREPGAPALRIALPDGVRAQKVGIADLDGDGAFDYVIKQPDFNVDPYVKYWKRSREPYKLEAYRADGRLLWRHDMGWAIEEGIWYSPYVAYDLDGDGKAEVAVKAGEGDPRDPDGKVTSGPEWLVILDGATGRERTRIAWPGREGFGSYNYSSRNLLGVAYLDGKRPALIVERGTYRRIVLVAYHLEGSRLERLWRWEASGRYRGQGMHGMHAADVDGDGRDEIVIGSAVVDESGGGLWATGLGHPDFAYVGDIDPGRPGLEIAYGIERRQERNGICLVDARSGKVLWGLDVPTRHVHSQGLVADLDAGSPGQEIYGGERDLPARWLFAAGGKLLSREDLGGLAPRAIWWDGDAQKEIIGRDGAIRKFGGGRALGRIRGRVIAIADCLGDGREEIVTSVDGALLVWSTSIPAATRRVTVMADRLYRLDVAAAAMGYFHPPQLGGYRVP